MYVAKTNSQVSTCARQTKNTARTLRGKIIMNCVYCAWAHLCTYIHSLEWELKKILNTQKRGAYAAHKIMYMNFRNVYSGYCT